MIKRLFSATVVGIDSVLVEIEVDVNPWATFKTIIVGLGDTAVQEARDRVKSAIKNNGYGFPRGRVTINLAPADLRKHGPAFDLPIALGILVRDEYLEFDDNILRESIFAGELALNGDLRPITGALSMALSARNMGFKNIFLPEENAKEAALVQGLNVYSVRHLREAIAHCTGRQKIKALTGVALEEVQKEEIFEQDMQYIKGQESAKRALEIAAAGAHNVLMNGPPGSGKTLLARTFASILPRMDMEEVLETTKIHSVAGVLPNKTPLVANRPFRSPHHTASSVALVGGGRFPKPGEISLAHRGVLFLDELAEFPAQVLEVLRQPLEDGVVTVSRATGSCTFPAKFILLSAMNPCPCGYATDPERQCTCPPNQIMRYQKKISGPLLDRIDLHIEVPRLDFEKISDVRRGEPSAEILQRVQQARDIQKGRFKDLAILTNTDMRSQEIDKFCFLDGKTKELLKQATLKMQLSGRALHRILKVSRTIADLEGVENIQEKHVAEALQYRMRLEGK